MSTRPAVCHFYSRCCKDVNLLLSPCEKYETCGGAVNNASLSADSCRDRGVSGNLRPWHTLPAAVNVKKRQRKTCDDMTLPSVLRDANTFTFFFSLNDLWAPNMRMMTFIRYKVKSLKEATWEHRCHPPISLPKQALMILTEAAACTDRTWHAGRQSCVCIAPVSWAGARISGILPTTALIVRAQKLLGEYGTTWPLLFLAPGAAESLWPPVRSDMFSRPLVKSADLSKGLRLSHFIYFVFNHRGSWVSVFFCPSLVVVGSWWSRCRKSGGVVWFTK